MRSQYYRLCVEPIGKFLSAFGANGTIFQSLLKFFKKPGIKKHKLKELALILLKDTLNTIHRHLCSPQI